MLHYPLLSCYLEWSRVHKHLYQFRSQYLEKTHIFYIYILFSFQESIHGLSSPSWRVS